MREYLMTLKYIAVHKWYVFVECLKFGIPLRGLLHDNSKLLPREFFPYAHYFYGRNGILRIVSPNKGYCHNAGATEEEKRDAEKCRLKADFNFSWNGHAHNNKHHWQRWLMPDRNEEGEIVISCTPMPRKYVLELVADWRGAGKAQGKPDTLAWYKENKDRMFLHPDTRKMVEELIGYEY